MPKSGPYSWATEIPVRHFVFLLAFTLLSKFQPLLERVLSLTAPTGATATLGFGQKLAQGLLLFAAFGLALTANATLARRVKMGQLDKAAELLAKTVVTTVLFSTLVVLGMLPVQRAVIEILFVRGEFSSSDAVAVNDVLLCQIPWVLVCALTGALTSYLYIEQNYRHVAIASIIGLAVTYAASVVLQPLLPLTAVPIASSAGAGLTLAWVVYLVIGSPVWQLLRTELKMYSELLVTCLLAVIASFSVAAGLRLLLDIEVSAVASGLVCSAILLVFIVGITFSRMLREQWRNVIGGRLS
jgi:putative peptidoglycan lipid II flippase